MRRRGNEAGNALLLAIFIFIVTFELAVALQHWQHTIKAVTVIHKNQQKLIDEGR